LIVISSFTDLQLTDKELENLTLLEIEKCLQSKRRTLHDFKSMPYPKDYVLQQLGNRLIYDERNYDVASLKDEFDQLFASLTGYIYIHLYKLIQCCVTVINLNTLIIMQMNKE
jgi:hypothetical protein